MRTRTQSPLNGARIMFPSMPYRTFRTIRILFHALSAHIPSRNSPRRTSRSCTLPIGHGYLPQRAGEPTFFFLTWLGSALKSTSFHCDGWSDWRWPNSESLPRGAGGRTKRASTHWRVLTVIIQWYLTADIAGQGHHHSCGMLGFALDVVNGSISHPPVAHTPRREDQVTR